MYHIISFTTCMYTCNMYMYMCLSRVLLNTIYPVAIEVHRSPSLPMPIYGHILCMLILKLPNLQFRDSQYPAVWGQGRPSCQFPAVWEGLAVRSLKFRI